MTATQVWDALQPALGETLERELRQLVLDHEKGRERSQQQEVGPSGLGKPCARCLAREVLGRPIVRAYDPHVWRRYVGVCVHAGLAEAALAHNMGINRGRYVIESKVYPDGPGSALLPKGGDSDLYDGDRATVVDWKTSSKARLKAYRANGPGQQYRFQAHLYGRGFVLLGLPVENVAIAFVPRDGSLNDLYVWTEPYDESVALQALDRYSKIRELALANGVAILPFLPADPDCFDCSGAAVTDEELNTA